jgi:hypothetical protein
MKEIITLAVISGLVFLIFVVLLILGFSKRKKQLKLISFLFLFLFFCLSGWAGFLFFKKSYYFIYETVKPRSGDEIYDAIFDKRSSNCVKVINFQDQIIPKIDIAIRLHIKTCPEELNRILRRQLYTKKTTIDDLIPSDKTVTWFNPSKLGDTLLIFEYSTADKRNIQTIWSNIDSTEIYVRDIFD